MKILLSELNLDSSNNLVYEQLSFYFEQSLTRMTSADMKKNFTPIVLLFLFLIPQFCSSQDYLGSWTLDWSQVMGSQENKSTKVSDDFETTNKESEKNPVWVFSMDSLKVYQNGDLISTAEIKWTRNDRFEIVEDDNKKNRIHYIDEIESNKIKMRTGYSDAEIYLRKM
jgi:hypothetical protein